ncbi:response regulator transcription factor [Acidovorax sp. Root219]|uniref:response regulator transcription factor n=1 Tax=Acidovorax sp. Root219 TaxID=1736493 RepID=UPI0009ECB10A|nr:response regulator transcription factor [Acidovorax sp. Root219]
MGVVDAPAPPAAARGWQGVVHRIRVGVVEDEPEEREAFAEHITAQPDMELVLVATNRAEALALLPLHAVDVLLVDLGLPDGSGLDVIVAARARWPDCNVLVSTIFGDEAHVLPSIEAGATGYLLKDSSAPGLVDEIRSVHAGGSPISPMVARKILARAMVLPLPPALAAQAAPAADARAGALALGEPGLPSHEVALSVRERAVLQLVSKGFNTEEAAATLGVSTSTVRTFVRRIYAKLQVRSRAGAIDVARRHGLLAD